LAKKDFPELTEEDCEIKKYTGRFRKGHCGLEFKVTSKTMPEEYKEFTDEVINSFYPT
jgi:hypothetical protein